jgi:hypothetical protein
MADRTYWLEVEDGSLQQAITSDLQYDDLTRSLGLKESRNRLIPVERAAPCKACPKFKECMGSVWLEGKRQGGPLLLEDVLLTEVVICHYCGVPALLAPLSADSGSKTLVSKACPRVTPKAGFCGDCRQFYSTLTKSSDAVGENRTVTVAIMAAAFADPDIAGPLTDIPEPERVPFLKRLHAVLAEALKLDLGFDSIVRALVLELATSPLGAGWHDKSFAARKFTIRCWLGVVRRVWA